jgi:hypothetical protein
MSAYHMPFLERSMLFSAGYSDAEIDRMDAQGTRPDGWEYPPAEPRDLPAMTVEQAIELQALAGGAA